MQVETAPEFEALAKRLGKTYRLVHQDVEKLIADLECGVRPQDTRLRNMGGMEIYKTRLPNTSARVGSRGGFRVVYRVKDGIIILLLLIWAKSQTVDIPDNEIRRVASQY